MALQPDEPCGAACYGTRKNQQDAVKEMLKFKVSVAAVQFKADKECDPYSCGKGADGYYSEQE
jgi:hypothetical protein